MGILTNAQCVDVFTKRKYLFSAVFEGQLMPLQSECLEVCAGSDRSVIDNLGSLKYMFEAFTYQALK